MKKLSCPLSLERENWERMRVLHRGQSPRVAKKMAKKEKEVKSLVMAKGPKQGHRPTKALPAKLAQRMLKWKKIHQKVN